MDPQQVQGFFDEMEKISLDHRTVKSAFNTLVDREMRVPHQVKDIAEGIVTRAHPRFKSWYLRTTPTGALRR